MVLIKMLFNHLTILGAVETIDYEYPDKIKKILDLVRQVVQSVSKSSNFECYTLGQNGINDPNFGIHWKNLIIAAFMPFITTVMCYIGFMLVSAIKNFRNPE